MSNCRKISINETQYNVLKRTLLTESQESKSISQAVALVMQRMGYDKTKADNFVRGEIRASFPVLRDKNAGKFILGVTRMFLDGDIKDGQTINRLNSSIKLLSTDHYDEYDRNLNGLKANDVIERFATSLQANIDNDRQELANQTYNNTSEYQIVPIDSYEEASAFSPYVSWCVTKSPHAFNNYTNDGVGQFYFCLKHGWKTMQEEVGDGTPLDEYGLSMIAVCVDSDGALQSCTCRWNHANGGNDAIMTTKEISQVIGQNFYDVFKPNNRLQRLVDDIKMRLQDGAQYKDVFSVCQAFGEHSLVVQLKQPRKWAIFSEDGDLLSSLYSDITSNLTKDIHDTIKTMIDSQGYYHLVDEYGKDYAQGNLINDCWFDRIKGKEYIHCKLGSYDDGGDLYNLFDHRKKEWLFNKNVGKAEIHEDFPYIVIDNEMGKENLFEPETKTLVFDKWYDLIYPNLWFKTFFLVRDYLYNDGSSNRKENLYDLSKKSFVFDEWVDEIDWPNNYGDVKITKDHKCNLFDLYNGKYITDLWFDDMYLDVCVIVVGDDEKGYNILNNERTDVAYPIWFSRVKSDGYSRTSGLVQARYNGATWWINKSGQLYLWDEQRENFKQIPLENLLNYDNTGVQESVNMNKKVIITESQESKSISAAKKLLQQRLGYDEKQADDFVRVKLRNDLPVLRTPEGGKFILGVTRMFLDGDLKTANDITNLNSTLKLVASEAHINEYDRNLNGMSSQDLISKFAKAISDNMNAEKEEINSMTFETPSDYNIIRIDSFEQAQEYSKFTSWCVTHYEDMFNSYTSDGINQFYFCLKDGFENEKPIKGENCPLDEYGLSMIAVSVNENGMLNTCTCRWNHDNGGDDNIMTTKEISQVVGQNFYNVFLPNNKWKTIVDDALQRLANGESIYGGVFDDVGGFYDGCARVKLNGKWNFINKARSLISNQWFDRVGDFYKGFAGVMLNNKWNAINTEGSLISDQWFDYVNSFYNGFAKVELNGKYNFINTEGSLVSNQWFDEVSIFYNGFAKVLLDGKENLINTEGSFISNQWFDWVRDFINGFAKVILNGNPYKLDSNGQLYTLDLKPITLESVNMNKKIIITESQFASLQNLLLIEAATIQDIQQKYYPNIDLDIMRQILSQGDPTWRQEKPDKMGKYGKWLLWLYQNRQLKLEDLYKAKEYLTYFIKFAQKIEDKDINHYKTLPQLYLTVKPFMDDPTQASSHQDEIRMAKEDAEKVYEDDVWLIVVPHTEEAAKYYGKNTQWCTAADNGNQFNYYNSQGPLYININKADNEKYQFHFESDQFMDETDTPIEEPIVENIPITSGAIAWYRENVDQWQMLRRQKIDFYVKDDIEANFYKYPETDWWLEDGSGNKIMENLRDVDIFIDQIWEEMNSNGWSDIPCTEGGSKLLVLSNESRYINGGYRSRFSLESLGGPYSHIECMSDSWDEYSYKVFKCVRPDGKITVKGQNDYHFNTFDASEIDDIFMYGDIIFYKFEDGQYIIQNMDDDEFNTVQIPERFEGQLNYDEWPYMYWIYTDNGHEMKINMETFDYRYLHADNYDENENF